MPDQDPLDQLSRLKSGLEGGSMLPPAEIRRRGDRRRRRTHALVAGGSALAVALIAIPIWVVAQPGDADIEPAPPAPSLTAIDPATELTEADLLSDDETVYSPAVDWFATDTYAGDGQEAFHPCARQRLSELGATGVVNRDYDMRDGPQGEPAPGNWMTESVAEFDSPEEARDAYERIGDQVMNCAGQIPATDRYDVRPPDPVDPGVEGEAELYFSIYGPPAESDYPEDEANIMETGLIVSGSRVAVITTVIVGQDYNFPVTPVQQMIEPAAALMQPGSDSGTSPPPEAASGELTDQNLITPEQLPAVPGLGPWEQVTEEGVPTLSCQGDTLATLGSEQSLTRNFTARYRGQNDAGARVRTAVLRFGDEESADAAYETVQGWLVDCPASQTDDTVRIQEPENRSGWPPSDYASVDRANGVLTTDVPPEIEAEGGEGAWWDHQTLIQVGDRLLLVSEAEFAGACGPITGDELNCEDDSLAQPWLDRATGVLDTAIVRASR